MPFLLLFFSLPLSYLQVRLPVRHKPRSPADATLPRDPQLGEERRNLVPLPAGDALTQPRRRGRLPLDARRRGQGPRDGLQAQIVAQGLLKQADELGAVDPAARADEGRRLGGDGGARGRRRSGRIIEHRLRRRLFGFLVRRFLLLPFPVVGLALSGGCCSPSHAAALERTYSSPLSAG